MEISHQFKKLLLFNTLLIVIGITTNCTNKNIKTIDKNITLEKQAYGYDVCIDYNTDYELRFTEVDSIAYVKNQLSIILYGKKETKDSKLWYYIGGGSYELKKYWGGWGDKEFKKYRLLELDKRKKIFSQLRTTKDLWKIE